MKQDSRLEMKISSGLKEKAAKLADEKGISHAELLRKAVEGFIESDGGQSEKAKMHKDEKALFFALLHYLRGIWKEAFVDKAEPNSMAGFYHRSLDTALKFLYAEGGGLLLEEACYKLGFDPEGMEKASWINGMHRNNLKKMMDFIEAYLREK